MNNINHNNVNNYTEDYELVNGYAIVDNNFSVITANEAMYKFLGISTHYSIVDTIHQVDLDDFIDVANTLRLNLKKSMCLRMKRVDNSYRWVLVDIEKKNIPSSVNSEYLELHISDILAIRNFNKELQKTIKSFTHIMAMDNELFYTYDFNTDIFTLNSFVDNELFTVMKDKIDDIQNVLFETNSILDEYRDEVIRLKEDILSGNIDYSHTIHARLFNDNSGNHYPINVKGSTIYSNLKPVLSVGSFKLIDNTPVTFSQKTYEYKNATYTRNPYDLADFCNNNISINPDCQLSIIYLEVDDIDKLITNMPDKLKDISHIIEDTILKVIEYRGMLCLIDDFKYAIVIKNINSEISLRAFLEHIRTMIAWNCKLIDPDLNIGFSIGIGRYPDNGTDLELIENKIRKAFAIAKKKGGSRYIIYKEALHDNYDLSSL